VALVVNGGEFAISFAGRPVLMAEATCGILHHPKSTNEGS